MSRRLIFWTVFLVLFFLLTLTELHSLREDPSDLWRWTLPWTIANEVLPANAGQLLSLVMTTVPMAAFSALAAFCVMLLVHRSGGGTEGSRLWNPPGFRTSKRTRAVVVLLVVCVLFGGLLAVAWPSATYLECQGRGSATTTVLQGPAAGVSSEELGTTWTQSRIYGLNRGKLASMLSSASRDVTFSEISNGGNSLLAQVLTICAMAQRGAAGYSCRLTVSRSHLSISASDQSQMLYQVEISRLRGLYDVSALHTGEGISFAQNERGTCAFDRRIIW